MSLFLNGIETNTVIFNGTETTGYFNGNLVWGTKKEGVPSDMDFIYLANDFNGTNIPNRAIDTDMGAYNRYGTITKNGSGADCYLTNNLSSARYLYINLTTDRLNAMKALDNTYTYFIRAYATSSDVGGLVSFRQNNSNTCYMIRTKSSKIQIHGSSGVNTLTLSTSKVFKVTINGTTVKVSDMEGSEQTVTIPTSRQMGSRMISFSAGYSGEGYLARFYGLAGIARATTSDEDKALRTLLLTQA